MSTYQEQKVTNPKIEDAILENLNGEKRKYALDFVTYLKANKMSPHWISSNSWKASYKQKLVCFIRVQRDFWNIRPALYNTSNPCDPTDFEKFIIGEKLEEFIWNNLKSCRNCLPCAPGKMMMIAGKELKNRCGYQSVQVNNPDIASIEKVKIILDYKKNAILKINTTK
jgi:hypothetical protein